MPELVEFPPNKPTDEEIEQWENSYFGIIEDLYYECGLCDEESLLDDMRKIIGNKEINDEIWDYSIEFAPTDIISPEVMTRIEDSLQGTCLRTNGPTYDWGDLRDSPRWSAKMELIGPTLEGETMEEITDSPFFGSLTIAIKKLIEAMEEEGIDPIIPQKFHLRGWGPGEKALQISGD
jgi:hypothetical protein